MGRAEYFQDLRTRKPSMRRKRSKASAITATMPVRLPPRRQTPPRDHRSGLGESFASCEGSSFPRSDSRRGGHRETRPRVLSGPCARASTRYPERLRRSKRLPSSPRTESPAASPSPAGPSTSTSSAPSSPRPMTRVSPASTSPARGAPASAPGSAPTAARAQERGPDRQIRPVAANRRREEQDRPPPRAPSRAPAPSPS